MLKINHFFFIKDEVLLFKGFRVFFTVAYKATLDYDLYSSFGFVSDLEVFVNFKPSIFILEPDFRSAFKLVNYDYK